MNAISRFRPSVSRRLFVRVLSTAIGFCAVHGSGTTVQASPAGERLEAGGTRTVVSVDKDTSTLGAPVTFTATVTNEKGIPSGKLQFVLDGAKMGDPIKLGKDGRAMWTTARLAAGKHQVSARYIPSEGSVFQPSTSAEKVHAVIRGGGGPARTQ